eukprot:403374194
MDQHSNSDSSQPNCELNIEAIKIFLEIHDDLHPNQFESDSQIHDEQQQQHLRRQRINLIESNAHMSDDLNQNSKFSDATTAAGIENFQHQRISNVSDSSADNQPHIHMPQEVVSYLKYISNKLNQSVKNQTLLRVLFSCGFLLILFYQMFNVDRIDVITPQQCMRDYTFIATETANQYLIDNEGFKNRYIIFASFLMDLMILSFLAMFYLYWKSYRIMFAYVLFFVTRTFLQKNFFMGRLDGFTFFYPGLYSITVPYHDVNDFFYSGHVGTCLLICLEYKAAKYHKMSLFIFFILINQWVMLCLVRTHYIIDLITGIIFAHYMYQHAEKISYVQDVLLLGIQAKNRMRKYYKPCKCCGWANIYAGDYCDEKEKIILKNMHRENKHFFQNVQIKQESEKENFEIGKEKQPSTKSFKFDEKSKYQKHVDDI